MHVNNLGHKTRVPRGSPFLRRQTPEYNILAQKTSKASQKSPTKHQILRQKVSKIPYF